MFKNKEIEEHIPRLEKFALRLTRNEADAQDLLQDTCVRAIEKKELFTHNGSGSLYSWLSKIMFNLFASQFKRKTKFEYGADPEDIIQNESVSATQDIKVEFNEVRRAISKMSENYRDVIVYVCMKGMPYEAAAEKLNIPVGTVRSRLSRARSELSYQLAA